MSSCPVFRAVGTMAAVALLGVHGSFVASAEESYKYEYGYGDKGVDSYNKYGDSYKYGSKYYPWKDYDGYYSKWSKSYYSKYDSGSYYGDYGYECGTYYPKYKFWSPKTWKFRKYSKFDYYSGDCDDSPYKNYRDYGYKCDSYYPKYKFYKPWTWKFQKYEKSGYWTGPCYKSHVGKCEYKADVNDIYWEGKLEEVPEKSNYKWWKSYSPYYKKSYNTGYLIHATATTKNQSDKDFDLHVYSDDHTFTLSCKIQHDPSKYRNQQYADCENKGLHHGCTQKAWLTFANIGHKCHPEELLLEYESYHCDNYDYEVKLKGSLWNKHYKVPDKTTTTTTTTQPMTTTTTTTTTQPMVMTAP